MTIRESNHPGNDCKPMWIIYRGIYTIVGVAHFVNARTFQTCNFIIQLSTAPNCADVPLVKKLLTLHRYGIVYGTIVDYSTLSK